MNLRKLDSWSGWAAGLTRLYTLLLLGAFPLFLDGSGYVRLTRAKFLTFATLSCIYLGLLLLRYLSACIGRETAPFSLKKLWIDSSLTQKALALFLLTACISALCSPYRETVWLGDARYNGLFTLLLLGGAFFAVSRFGAFQKAHALTFGGAALLLAGLGIVQCAGGNPFGLYPAGETFFSLQFASTLGNIDFVATFCSMSVPFCAAAVIAGRTAKRYFMLVPMIAGALLLWLTGVEGGRVAVAGSFVLLLPLVAASRDRLKHFLLTACVLLLSVFAAELLLRGPVEQPPFGWLAGAALFGVAAALVGALGKGGAYPGRALSVGAAVLLAGGAFLILGLALTRPAGGDTDRLLDALGAFLKGTAPDYVGHGRVGIWRRALEMAGDRLLIGSGPDSFARAFAAKFPEFVTETAGTALYDAAHNEYLQYLCLYGIPGAVAYLVFYLSLVVRGALAARDGGAAGLPLLSAVLGYGIGAVFSLSFVGTAPVFFVLAGLLEAFAHTRGARAVKGKKRPAASAFEGL